MCTVNITATVNGTWPANSNDPWVIGQLPGPKNGEFACVGYSKTGGTIRFIFSETGWLKPWYNQNDIVDGTEFSVHVSYITA